MAESVISKDLTDITKIELVEKLPEEVTGTTMRKFCFRRVEHSIIIVYLENKDGQSFELKIDESTSRAITRLFDEHKTKIPKT
jgi:hypothetical protein